MMIPDSGILFGPPCTRTCARADKIPSVVIVAEDGGAGEALVDPASDAETVVAGQGQRARGGVVRHCCVGDHRRRNTARVYRHTVMHRQLRIQKF